jgi:hypothetical protein
MNRKFMFVLSALLAIVGLAKASPVGLNIGNDTTICSGTCLTLTSNITGTYLWSTGATTASISVCPPNTQTISLVVKTGTGTYTDQIHITVDNKCVYPGDANDNGVVSLRDVLNVGLAYGSSGSARANASSSWNAQHADNWKNFFRSGLNYKYADCNGDGKVDANDLSAILSNWSETHSKTENDTTTVPGNPQLYLVTSSDTFYPGENVNFNIYLGTATNQALNVYGVDFSYQFTPGSVQSGSMSLTVNPTNCWLYGTSGSGSVMSFLAPDYTNDIANVAISRTMGPGQNGYGQIGVLGITINDNVGGKTGGRMPLTYGFIQEEAVAGDESDIPLTAVNKTIYMMNQTLGIKAAVHLGNAISVYPNPVEGNNLNIDLKNINADRISISDMLGNIVYNEARPISGLNQLHLPVLNSGMYIVQIATQQGIIMRKININR